MTSYQVSVNGTSYAVKLLERKGASIRFEYNKKEYSVDVVREMPDVPETAYVPSGALSGGASSSTQAGPGQVCAPMPGIITSLLVKEGQQVTKGDPVLIMEAMKMENNIPSPDSGKVVEILVQEGAEVEKGCLLLRLETDGDS